jgi:hypothetical protein
MAMKYWQTAALGMGCFLLVSWYSTSIVLSDNGQLEVCGQTFMFGEIEQGKTKAIQYKVRSDSQYKLEVEFHSGRKLEQKLGDVRSGLDFEDILTLSDHEMSLTR